MFPTSSGVGCIGCPRNSLFQNLQEVTKSLFHHVSQFQKCLDHWNPCTLDYGSEAIYLTWLIYYIANLTFHHVGYVKRRMFLNQSAVFIRSLHIPLGDHMQNFTPIRPKLDPSGSSKVLCINRFTAVIGAIMLIQDFWPIDPNMCFVCLKNHWWFLHSIYLS